MAATAPRLPLRPDEAAALAVAALAHIGLVLALIYLKPAAALPPPERMRVTISDDAALVATAPDPQADPAADRGPVAGDAPPPPAPPAPPVVERPAASAAEPRRPIAAAPRPAPAPAPRSLVQPRPDPRISPVAPQPKPAAPRTSAPQIKPPPHSPAPPRPGTRPGNSRFDAAFGSGIPGGKAAGKGSSPPAQATGPQRASWSSLIGSKVKVPWDQCKVTGLDIEQLYVDISFTLARDGSIQAIAEPVVGGVSPANRNQVAPFKACAVRAIKLAAPFRGLPPEFHDDWMSRKLRLRKKEQ